LHKAAARMVVRDFRGAAALYREAIRADPVRSEMYLAITDIAKEGSLKDHFFGALVASLETTDLRIMMNHIASAPKIYQPSQFWLYFSTYNALQIELGGIENFKRTVNNNYFNWTAEVHVDQQLNALKKLSDASGARRQAGSLTEASWPAAKREKYLRLLELLFRYTQSNDRLHLLEQVGEPRLGNPISLRIDNRDVTQDLCQTVLDVTTIIEHTKFRRDDRFTVYELGAGHGRMGYALLKSFPNARYVVIDIPPALYVSQWYLTTLFPALPTLKFRETWGEEELKGALGSARLVFLSPDQVERLPDLSCDIFINICSLQEMSTEQVENWFAQIDRLCSGYFYTKQYFEHENSIDGLVIRQVDYPVRENWKQVFTRPSPTFPSLFEAIYKMASDNATA
jgi:putative sugar O-methyltransferase